MNTCHKRSAVRLCITPLAVWLFALGCASDRRSLPALPPSDVEAYSHAEKLSELLHATGTYVGPIGLRTNGKTLAVDLIVVGDAGTVSAMAERLGTTLSFGCYPSDFIEIRDQNGRRIRIHSSNEGVSWLGGCVLYGSVPSELVAKDSGREAYCVAAGLQWNDHHEVCADILLKPDAWRDPQKPLAHILPTGAIVESSPVRAEIAR